MSTTHTAVLTNQQHTLGQEVPPFTPHAISVSLPTWKDNVGYEEGEKRVVDAMVTGYPRFFIHRSIAKLARICEQKFGAPGERSLLCPTRKIAEQCRSFMLDRLQKEGKQVPVRLVQFFICPRHSVDSATLGKELHIVLFPGDVFPVAKQFWQHTGLCISSRLAERCLSMLPEESASPPSSPQPTRPLNKHYNTTKNYQKGCTPSPPAESSTPQSREALNSDQSFYLEERYGRNMPLESAAKAKRALRRRIAGVLVRDSPNDWSSAGTTDAEVGPSTRGVSEVTEDDVFLYSTGMSSIWSAHQLALAVRPVAKSICFGFPYTDTLKILQKWGPGCHFLGHGLDQDIDELESILAKESANSDSPPALALFTEFPSNPLLRCANLVRLRALADKYDFLIVVDETLGNFVNVEVLPYADIVVSSLSKIFSGDANVMGGSLVLNPRGRHYQALKTYMVQNYEDSYFEEDAIFMERNSRDFRRRIAIVDSNTEAVCDLLRSHSLESSSPPPNAVVKRVFYPKWETRSNFERHRVRVNGEPTGGFGGLFSITFTSATASRVFFDTLPCLKGPSLGTNFTLASPYAILAHYAELEWANGYGVEECLVRVSVGMEERQSLLQGFELALAAAEAAAKSE